MFEDEDAKLKKPKLTLGQELTTLSIAELEDYIATLEAEIARIREAIAGKRGHRGAAEALFRR